MMPISWVSVLWAFVSLLSAGYAGYTAFLAPEGLAQLTDALVSAISILIAVSLTISAIISVNPVIGLDVSQNEQERKRIKKVVRSDDSVLMGQQHVVFLLYYAALILNLGFKFVVRRSSVDEDSVDWDSLGIKGLAALLTFFSALALLWSATLFDLLRKINKQRKHLD